MMIPDFSFFKVTTLLLGTNLGDRLQNLAQARDYIASQLGEIEITSAIYQTAPWGKTDQPEFLNQAVRLKTTLEPEVLLQRMLCIERLMGRERLERWGERLIDIDLMTYEHQIIDSPTLTVPHPRMQERRFALLPLQEVLPQAWTHPINKKNIEELIAACPDTLAVSTFSYQASI